MGFGFSGSSLPSTLITQDITYFITTAGDDTTGNGSSGSPWLTLDKVFSFLANKSIATDVTVTIDIADGTYVIATPLEISHPNGDRISIVGNAATEANVILDFTSSTDGITLTNNNSLGSINGLTIRGTWVDDGTGLDKSAILITQNSSITLGANITINKFYYGIKADTGGSAFADSCVVTNGGKAAFFAGNGGTIEANNASATGIVYSALSLGSGFFAEVGGTIRGDSFTATTCKHSGVNATGGSIECNTLSSDSNTGHGIYADRGGNILSSGPSTADSNGASGLFMVRNGIFGSFSTLSLSSNGTYGVFMLESSARLNGANNINTNALDNVFVSQGSHLFLKAGTHCDDAVAGAGVSITDNSNCQFTNASSSANDNATWGIQCELGSTITATGTILTGNTTAATNITTNTLAADGAYIKA